MASNERPLSPAQTAWLLATAVAAFLPLLAHLPGWLSVVTGLALAWRTRIAWYRQSLPPRWLITLLAIVVTIAVAVHFRSVLGQNAGVALLTAFLALKQFESRTARDGRAIVLLGYFLALSQYFYSQSVITAAMTLAVVVIATASLACLCDDRLPPLRLARLAGQMLLQATPFMLIFFFLFPRIPGPLWGLPRDAYSGLTGMSDSMSPGSFNQLLQSDGIALRAKFEPAPPARNQLYWRGPVLTRFDGRTWRADLPEARTQIAYAVSGPAIDYELTLEAHNRTWLFALDLPDRLPPNSTMTADYTLLARTPVQQRQRLSLRAFPTTIAGADEAGRMRQRALALPPAFNPRTRALGERWRAEYSDDRRIVAAAIDFFRTQQLAYTLTPPLLGEHSIDEFLFEAKQGFCEHFSGAFVFALRAAGVPARVVVGYHGGEINPIDGYLVVRQYDAHAWAEAWLSGRGWVRIDPTAISVPARIDMSLAAAIGDRTGLPLMARTDLAWLRDLRFRWEAATNAWNQWVIGYNQERQVRILTRLGMAAPDWRQMIVALASLSGLALLALAYWTLRRRPRIDPALAVWNRLDRRLARRGLGRHAWEGPYDYAARVATALPARAQEIQAIAALYARLRYHSASAVALDELRRRVAHFAP